MITPRNLLFQGQALELTMEIELDGERSLLLRSTYRRS